MKFYLIGLDDNKQPCLTDEVRDIIAAHRIFSGGARHQGMVGRLLPASHRWIEIRVPLEEVFRQYGEEEEVVVFVSGDPLFFGFAHTIQQRLPEAEIAVFPHFHSLQQLAHRLLMPYQDLRMVSLTGRSWQAFDEALISGYEAIGVLTDRKEHTPDAIARRMLDYGYGNYTLTIGELLGNRAEENVSVRRPEEVAGCSYAYPNNLILRRTHPRPRPLGIPDEAFELLDGRAKMITKMPVRLLTLSMLDLRERRVAWDIGFCTGAVSVEMRLQFPQLQVVAFEKRAVCAGILEANARRFGTPGIQAVTGDFLHCDLSVYPPPDAVFVGGHGGQLDEITAKVSEVLRPSGVLVFNAVSEASRALFIEAIARHGLSYEQSVSIQVDQFNRIEVMKANKIR
jgi:precorrin-6Y C5,15-methyltransferase (decarboxylating)